MKKESIAVHHAAWIWPTTIFTAVQSARVIGAHLMAFSLPSISEFRHSSLGLSLDYSDTHTRTLLRCLPYINRYPPPPPKKREKSRINMLRGIPSNRRRRTLKLGGFNLLVWKSQKWRANAQWAATISCACVFSFSFLGGRERASAKDGDVVRLVTNSNRTDGQIRQQRD